MRPSAPRALLPPMLLGLLVLGAPPPTHAAGAGACRDPDFLPWACDPQSCATPGDRSVLNLETSHRIGNDLAAALPALTYAATHGCAVAIHPHPALLGLAPCPCLVPATRRTGAGSNCSAQPRRLAAWWLFPGWSRPTMARMATAGIRLFLGINNTSVAHRPCDHGPGHLTVKIRSGDVMSGEWRDGHWYPKVVHRKYAQPPLYFYLSVLGYRRWKSVHILSEDANNPITPVLQQINAVMRINMTVRTNPSLDEVIYHMGCSRNVVQATGTMNLAWSFSPHIRQEFRFVFQKAGCAPCASRTVHLFQSLDPGYFSPSANDPKGPPGWLNSAENRSRMLQPHPLALRVCPPR